jgi:serine/threonine protein kinase
MADDTRLGLVLGDRYRVDELIGRGGMSTVYRGFDTRLQRVIAIKVFQHGEDDDEKRWESEVRLLSQLSHPHLVTLHDAHLEPAGEDRPSYLVMEYVPGSSLQQHLAEHGPSAPLAALVIAQIGEALESVHSRGIVHRDLKPGNILVEPSELPPLLLRTKLADFGIAHLLGSDRATRTGTMVGTAAYTSPEQVNGDAATPASDVYSLGLVAMECLTGRPVFAGTASESLIARLTRDPMLPAGLPPTWTVLLASMTARDPNGRPTALAAALRARELVALPVDVAPETVAMVTDPQAPTERMPAPTLLLPAAPTADSSSVGRTTRSPRFPILAGVAVVAAVILGIVGVTHLPAGSASPEGSTSATPTPVTTPTSPSPSPSASVPAPGNGHGHGNGNGNGKKGNG